MIVKINDFVV